MKNEIVRYIDDEIIAINSTKKYTTDVIVLYPLKHVNNQELIQDIKLLQKTFITAEKIINEQYKGQARILINYGNKYASIPEHTHLQIMTSVGTGVYLPPMGKMNYEVYKLSEANEEDILKAVKEITPKKK